MKKMFSGIKKRMSIKGDKKHKNSTDSSSGGESPARTSTPMADPELPPHARERRYDWGRAEGGG